MKSLTAPPLWRILSTFAVIAIIGVLALPGVVQAEDAEVSPSGRENIKKLNTCIDNKKKADLIFVIDESASLKGHGGKPATDPNNIRVPAMQDLVTQLGKFAQESNADINVKLSGFGQGYRSQPDVYGGWVNVRDHAGDLTPPIQGFDQRNNDVFTDYGTALNGAMADLASRPDPESCKAILFFTDGKLTVQGDPNSHLFRRRAGEETPGRQYSTVYRGLDPLRGRIARANPAIHVGRQRLRHRHRAQWGVLQRRIQCGIVV